MERQITWKTSTGQSVVATLGIRTSKLVSLDGDQVEHPCCEWYEHVCMGNQCVGYDIRRIEPQVVSGVELAGRCGNCGIPAAQMDAIDRAKAELRATPEWLAHEVKRGRREIGEYYAHDAAVERMMMLGGRTY